jgi:hypothetical protein
VKVRAIAQVTTVLVLSAALLGGGPGGAGQSADGPAAEDIRGPLGPMPAPAEGAPRGAVKVTPRRALAAAVLGGFLLMGLYFVRRRRAPDNRPGKELTLPGRELLKLPDTAFYERLMDELRDALDSHGGRPARVLTPRELERALAARLGGELGGRLRDLRERVEAVLYAAGRTTEEARRRHLHTAVEALRALREEAG